MNKYECINYIPSKDIEEIWFCLCNLDNYSALIINLIDEIHNIKFFLYYFFVGDW